MSDLILKRLDWGDGTPPTDDDWTVWFDNRIVGRILFAPVGNSPGKPWMWTITANAVPGYTMTNSHGQAANRESAMIALRKRWDQAGMGERLREAE